MGYNYAYERAKFEAEWKKKEEWYRFEGMSEEAIQEMRELDWNEFKGNRIYMLHNQEMPADGIIELMAPQTHGTYAAVNDEDLTDQLLGRYGWIEKLENPALIRLVRNLSHEEIEILTMTMEGYTQTEIGRILGCNQSTIGRKIKRFSKVFESFQKK